MDCTLKIWLNEHISTHFTQQISNTLTHLNTFAQVITGHMKIGNPWLTSRDLLFEYEVQLLYSDERGQHSMLSTHVDKRYAFSLPIVNNTAVQWRIQHLP